jgi:hypothetical protein
MRKDTDVSEDHAASIIHLALKMEEARTFEMFVSQDTTRRHKPEDLDLNLYRREGIKSRKKRSLNATYDKFRLCRMDREQRGCMKMCRTQVGKIAGQESVLRHIGSV